MSKNLMKIRGLSKIYTSGSEKLMVLDNLDLDVEKGSVTIITGASGSGKSTLLNLVSGLDSPSSGTILINGKHVESLNENELSEYRRVSIGLIFQFHYLLNDFSALENVMLPMFMTGETKKRSLERAYDILGEIGLADRVTHFPQELSGGERQRVAVARALINEPDIILADEPTGNLDEKNSERVMDLLLSLVEKHSRTLLLVTHDSIFLGKGDRQLRLERGVLKEI